MGDDAHMFDDLTPREMYRMLKEAEANIMLSGGRSQFVALKASMPWMDINQERHAAFAGYHGMVEMVKEIDRTLVEPGVAGSAPCSALGRGRGQLAEPRDAGGGVMAAVVKPGKACTVNPLKMSQPMAARLPSWA